MAILFAACVVIVTAGVIWFHILRPMLESFGLIRAPAEPEAVNDYQEADAVVMSRASIAADENPPPSLQTDSRQTTDRPMMPTPARDVMLDTYRSLRKHGYAREEARAMLKALGLPLDNNLWSKATEEPTERAPISGRPIPPGVKYHEDEPELEYQPLER